MNFKPDIFFYLNVIIACVNLGIVLSCYPSCARKYKWVFLAVIVPMSYMIGVYAYELITWSMPEMVYLRVATTTNLLLLTTFTLLTRHGNGYGEH